MTEDILKKLLFDDKRCPTDIGKEYDMPLRDSTNACEYDDVFVCCDTCREEALKKYLKRV